MSNYEEHNRHHLDAAAAAAQNKVIAPEPIPSEEVCGVDNFFEEQDDEAESESEEQSSVSNLDTVDVTAYTLIFYRMLHVQSELNHKSYDSAWLDKCESGEFDYAMAAVQELSEFIESQAAYKWWGGKLDIKNCRTELVDAFHFIMSLDIAAAHFQDQSLEDVARAYAAMALSVDKEEEQELTPRDVKDLAKSCMIQLLTDTLDIADFINLCAKGADMSVDLLFARYIGKATLNKFRAANGYKEGKYKKIWWANQEDNFYLADYVDNHFNAYCKAPDATEIEHWIHQTHSRFINGEKL